MKIKLKEEQNMKERLPGLAELKFTTFFTVYKVPEK